MGPLILFAQSESETSGREEGRGVKVGGDFPCGVCGREVNDDDEAIYCESGCEQWYHR